MDALAPSASCRAFPQGTNPNNPHAPGAGRRWAPRGSPPPPPARGRSTRALPWRRRRAWVLLVDDAASPLLCSGGRIDRSTGACGLGFNRGRGWMDGSVAAFDRQAMGTWFRGRWTAVHGGLGAVGLAHDARVHSCRRVAVIAGSWRAEHGPTATRGLGVVDKIERGDEPLRLMSIHGHRPKASIDGSINRLVIGWVMEQRMMRIELVAASRMSTLTYFASDLSISALISLIPAPYFTSLFTHPRRFPPAHQPRPHHRRLLLLLLLLRHRPQHCRRHPPSKEAGRSAAQRPAPRGGGPWRKRPARAGRRGPGQSRRLPSLPPPGPAVVGGGASTPGPAVVPCLYIKCRGYRLSEGSLGLGQD